MEKWVLDGTQSDEEKPVHQQEETVALPASEGEEGGRGCGEGGEGGRGLEILGKGVEGERDQTTCKSKI